MMSPGELYFRVFWLPTRQRFASSMRDQPLDFCRLPFTAAGDLERKWIVRTVNRTVQIFALGMYFSGSLRGLRKEIRVMLTVYVIWRFFSLEWRRFWRDPGIYPEAYNAAERHLQEVRALPLLK